ncbi:MAG: hypothetical protein DWH91_16000 [Planctomycetota bacterium]|nr:MAG: hypothetical protein DWH91_16000 [Planctomycetota bacterium]
MTPAYPPLNVSIASPENTPATPAPVWRRVHRCDDGGVQSLSFVLTLPIFLGAVLMIVQLCQMLLGVMTVQYAAFAGARAAVVWIPANTEEASQNNLPWGNGRENVVSLDVGNLRNSRKYQEVFGAAAQVCVAISPARLVRGPRTSMAAVAEPVEAFLTLQQLMSDPRIAQWRTATGNRWSYAQANTRVRIAWLAETAITPTYNPIGHPVVEYEPAEVSWDDAVTVVVSHEVALVPGPGRWFFRSMRWGRVPQNLDQDWTTSERLDRVPVVGSATLSVAGIKSQRPLRYRDNAGGVDR